MPSPTKDHPRLPPPTTSATRSIHAAHSQSPTRLHSPASSPTGRGLTASGTPVGSPHRTLRRLASAHNLGQGSAASLRASIANPPSLIAQQRLHKLHHHQPPSATSPRRNISPARRNATLPGSPLNRSPPRGRVHSDAPIVHQLNAAAAAMSSTALRNSGALSGRTAYDHIPLEKLIRDGPPDWRLVGIGWGRDSWSFQAMAFSNRIREASLTRRRKRGSVVKVRKVSLRILA
ncbi:CDC16 protein [Gnomoniopsis sp. IMI 355080]|nr:CDC16 protein [Gnomoniopsis sp. IMI 355080]